MALLTTKEKEDLKKKIVKEVQTEAAMDFNALKTEEQMILAIAALIKKLKELDSSYRNYIQIDIGTHRPKFPGEGPTIAEEMLEQLEVQSLGLDNQLTVLTTKLANTQNKKHATKVKSAQTTRNDLRLFKYAKTA
jgi:hypothetical protein